MRYEYYHEGFDFASMIEHIDMEWVNPVSGASALIPTEPGQLPEPLSDALKVAADVYPVDVQAWWQRHRIA